MALMKLDVLGGLETLQVCTGYRYRGELLTEFPNETDILAECEPVYETLPGWTENTVGIVDEAKLPANCQAHLRRLEAAAGVPRLSPLPLCSVVRSRLAARARPRGSRRSLHRAAGSDREDPPPPGPVPCPERVEGAGIRA